MKQHIVRFLHAACLCLVASLPSAFAQSGQTATVDLPFGFQLANQQFPAGKYQVTGGPGQAAVLLRGVDSKRAMFILSIPLHSERTRDVSSLVFHRYGNRYFLSEIWLAGSTYGRALPKSTAEREVARSWAESASEAIAFAGPPK